MKKVDELVLIEVTEEEDQYDIRLGDIKIGDATLSMYSNCITIENIDIAEAYQGKGYGKEVVSMLKKMPGINCLIGDSVPEALTFWLKMGAVFDWGELERLEETGHALVGFEISWKA